MAIQLVHIVDEQTPEDAVRLCSLLLRKLPAAEVCQSVVVLGHTPAGLAVPDGLVVRQIGRPLRAGTLLSTATLGRKLEGLHPGVIFAYSGMAAAAAASGPDRVPLVAIVADPGDAADTSRWILSGYGGPIDVVCLSGTVQRRLVEHGVPMVSTAVIRAGVDFAEIRPRTRESFDCSQLDVPADTRVMVTPSPPSRAGGQFHAVWAIALLHHIWPDAVLIVSGTSREQRRIARLIETIYCPQAYRLTEDRYSPAELLAVADALLVPAVDDVPTGWLAWAMAAGVPIIGSAVPCVTEFVADRHNGSLCRPGEPHTLAIRIRTAFESSDLMRECVQTSRHQAYEAFRSERCIDEFLKVIRNMADRRPALAGVQDAAMQA